MRFRITDKFGSTLGFVTETNDSLIWFLLLPFAPLLIIGLIGGVLWLSFALVSFLLPTLAGFGSGDTMSYEVAGLCIATIISWVIAYLIIVFSKQENLDYSAPTAIALIPLLTYIFTIIALIYVDITYNNAFGDVFRIIWFIVAIMLHMIVMLFWTLATSIVGAIIVLVLGFLTRFLISSTIYQFKLRTKMKKIKNSEYLSKLFNELDKKEIRMIKIEDNDLTIIDLDKKEKSLSFIKDGYSSLDDYGRLALAVLIHQNYKYLKISDNGIVTELYNKELIKKEQKEEVQKDIDQKKEEKRIRKDNLKKGKDW